MPQYGLAATVSRLEAGEELKPRTIAAIRSALESAGVRQRQKPPGLPSGVISHMCISERVLELGQLGMRYDLLSEDTR
jgi:hypothetical protein